jgi:DNA-binding XRE family transcriptional regulator
MQADFADSTISGRDRIYNCCMGRKLTKPRPKQGARLAELRQAAGLSQYELARIIGVAQPNIAFWEMSEKPPRSDLLPRMAKALGVSVEQLLNTDSVKKITERKGGPTGKVRKVFERVSRLPRH